MPTVAQDTGWQIGGTGDFNGDGHTDIFWRNYEDGQNAVWLMNGPVYSTNANPAPMTNSDLDWKTVGVDHFNAGDQIDLLWRHAVSSEVGIWFMNGANFDSAASVGFRDLAWTISATGDSRRDSDADALADLWERNYFGNDISLQNASGDPDGDSLSNLQEYQGGFRPNEAESNVLVNDSSIDDGNEQNSQFESTIAVLNDRVIVAYVDSNQIPGTEPRDGGVYGFGSHSLLPDRTPRFVSYSILDPGNTTFTDVGTPPLSQQGSGSSDDGDAGDPVLAVNQSSGVVYLAGTSARNDGQNGIPLWKSTDGGITFGTPITVRPDIERTDKPWIAVDNTSGTGQHDVYLACQTIAGTLGLWLTVSTDGSGGVWNTPVAVRTVGVDNVAGVASPIIALSADHKGQIVWFERTTSGVNYLKTRSVQDRGAVLGGVNTVVQLVTTHGTSGNLELKRSNSAHESDTFRAFPFPVVAFNPNASKANHLYVAYADKAQNTDPNDRADVFFLRSTNGGVTWDDGNGSPGPFRLSTETTNDQWMPGIAVKPDGTKLFVTWYDRRKDEVNNSLMDLYGRWADISPNGTVVFGTEFRITTVNFPPVFAGTLSENTMQGHYDPVYPPNAVNLNWWYPEWPTGQFDTTTAEVRDHVGEYNGTSADGSFVYISWTDYRLLSVGTQFSRNQSDIRFARLVWP